MVESAYIVGRHKSPNELGLYDMSGNIIEWCEDVWRYYDDTFNAIHPPESNYRVARGGGWHALTVGCRVSYRDVFEMLVFLVLNGLYHDSPNGFVGDDQDFLSLLYIVLNQFIQKSFRSCLVR